MNLLIHILLQGMAWLLYFGISYSFLMFIELEVKNQEVFKNKFKVCGIVACIMSVINMICIQLGW
ncbi:hypothetical protein [Turicibacter sanguinis]|uniref:hypothetical protein n=1 Tax=Turicibacter sanguinis TaxID=154288 RepID=UPI002943B71E|nr:hypothetical protein [Turicibacter sanguinis]